MDALQLENLKNVTFLNKVNKSLIDSNVIIFSQENTFTSVNQYRFYTSITVYVKTDTGNKWFKITGGITSYYEGKFDVTWSVLGINGTEYDDEYGEVLENILPNKADLDEIIANLPK